ncbi:hypothetical protein [Flavobacterium sp.]|uniref:hypothetical protein n=1 Tax=Flavobacterium sp. TaxID=239 RepID=UPI003D0B62FE
MSDLDVDEKLNKNKFFLIKNAIVINILVVFALVIMLYLLKIEKESILELIFKYYLN